MLERYEELLKMKGIKHIDVVRGAGISQSTLSEWRKGKYELKLDKIIALCDFFGVSLDYFVRGSESDTSKISLMFNELNDEGKEQLLKRASELLKLGYIKSHKSDMVSA